MSVLYICKLLGGEGEGWIVVVFFGGGVSKRFRTVTNLLFGSKMNFLTGG